MTFLYPSLAIAGAVLALAPIVAHLLNRSRIRRVEWAAMEFLLESDRRNRTWVRLSEWLLLLARVAAIALAGLLVAGPRAGSWFSRWLVQGETLHLVLLDDSGSMSQRRQDATAWDHAGSAIGRLIEATRQRESEGRLVIARYSQDTTGEDSLVVGLSGGAAPDWDRVWESMAATSLAEGPIGGLERLASEARAAKERGQTCYAYVLSDFSSWNHGQDSRWEGALEALAAEASGLVLSPCGAGKPHNLTIESLTLEPGPRAAGVEMQLRVVVKNQSPDPAPAVEMRLERDGAPLPALTVGPFEPGESVVETLPVVFSGVGAHVLQAEAPADALPIDDRRSLAIDLPAEQPVLLVDGSLGGLEGRAFSAALRPGGVTRTGWSPRLLASGRPETLGDLSRVAAVLLLDTPGLSLQAEEELRRFVESGGGLLLTLGPSADVGYYSNRFGGEAGVAPWSLGLPTQAPWVESGRASLAVAEHPALRLLGGEANALLPMVRVALRHTVAIGSIDLDDASQPSDEGKTLVSLTDGTPLVIESQYGRGRVISLLTSVASRDESGVAWSNLASAPVFPVVANELLGWITEERLKPGELIVGHAAAELVGSVGEGRVQRLRQGRYEDFGTAESAVLEPGVYRVADSENGRLFAAGVDPREGQLEAPSTKQLRQEFGGLAEIVAIDELFRDPDETGDTQLVRLIAAFLLLLLTAERLLARHCSYLQPNAGGQP